jgi:prevent-host-death family protein
MAAPKIHPRVFNIAEAKARFSELVQKAMMGEDVIIAKDNKPVLKLVPLEQAKRQQRQPGSAKGQVWIAPDFDQLPDDFKDYV